MFPIILLGTDKPEGHSCDDHVLSLMAKQKYKTLGSYLKCIKSDLHHVAAEDIRCCSSSSMKRKNALLKNVLCCV